MRPFAACLFATILTFATSCTCRHSDCRVIDSREVDDGQATRRRRRAG